MAKLSFWFTALIAISAVLGVLLIFLPFNIWIQIWTAVCLLDAMYLGILYIGLSALFFIGFIIAKGVKWKLNFIIIAAMLLVAGILVLIDPEWYYNVYFT